MLCQLGHMYLWRFCASCATFIVNLDLNKILQANVLHSFQQLQEMMGNEYSQEDQQIIGCPSLEQVYCNKMFLELNLQR